MTDPRTARALRRAWRQNVRRLKRRLCAACGYPARMHPDERRDHGWAGPAWRTVNPDHYFEEPSQ